MTIVAYRIASWRSPWWVDANPYPHRYNRPGAGPTQYLSLHPLTPWAEYLRGANVRTEAQIRSLRLRYWVMRVDDAGALPLTFETAEDWGMKAFELVADDHAACQAFGDRCREDSTLPDAAIVPSAALPGTENMVIFGPRVSSPFEIEPVDSIDVPTAIGAERARPLHTLLERVRYYGESHEALDAWRDGSGFIFHEPATPMVEYC